MRHDRYRMQTIETSKQVRIAFVGGGSLNWAMGLMADLAYDQTLAADVRLYDIDHDAALRNAQIGTRCAEVSRGTPANYTACRTLKDALHEADVVVISILPGGFEDMAQDIDIPARFGIPQAVGDTVGPGGFVRALRAIPMLADIAQAIKDHAPDAFVCNLTNPMSALTGTLFKVFPTIKAWGECHEVTKIRTQVAWIANQKAGGVGYTHRDVQANVLGINHFTFVDALVLDGVDMMPAYKAFAETFKDSGWDKSEQFEGEKAQYFGSRNLVAFDLYRRFGLPGAAGDRHLAEFFPVAEYLNDPAKWGFALTPVAFRIKERAAKIKAAHAMRDGHITPIAKRSDEAVIDQISALVGGGSFVSNVNLPNTGQLDGLPEGAIVETNARFDRNGVTPLPAGKLPDELNRIVNDHAARQTALVDAVLANDKDALFPLFKSDPLVRSLQTSQAKQMFDQMISATARLIPEAIKGAA